MLATPPARAASVPAATRQVIAVQAPTRRASTGTLSAYARRSAAAPWRRVSGPWPAELGRAGLRLRVDRREGDGTTPLGSFALSSTVYGNAPRPSGLHTRYRRLSCGDWWDEDPSSPRYNRFVAVPCGTTPAFGPGSEALWLQTRAYPYFAVIRFNTDPVRRGPQAPGSGIFLHSWVGAATNGCVAIHRGQLVRLLRWLRPAAHPRIAIAVGPPRARGGPSRATAG